MFGFVDRNRLFSPRENGRIPAVVLRNRRIEVCAFAFPSTLGKNHDEVDMCVFDPSVSRVHLNFGLYQGRVTVTDTGSASGTKINGVFLKPGVPFYLDDNATLVVGKVKFKAYVNYDIIPQLENAPRVEQPEEQGGLAEFEMPDEGSENNTRILFSNGPDPGNAAASVGTMGAQAGNAQVSTPAANTGTPAEMNSFSFDSGTVKPEEDDYLEISEFEVIEEPEFSDETGSSDGEELDRTSSIFNEDEFDKTEILAPDASDSGVEVHLRRVEPAGDKDDIIKITWTPFVVGRTDHNTDYVLDSAGISRRHFFIDSTRGIYYITDLNSTNGVRINRERIKPMSRTQLKEGDVIRVGKLDYVFEVV